MSDPLNIIFMGTPDFAAVALQALIDSPHHVIAAYSQPPRPKGRGHQVQKSPVHLLAEQNDIPVYTPKSVKSEQAQQEFAALGADIAIVAAYGLILPKAILEAPRFGCLNIHASLLPRWRGAAPIQYAIWQGDEESGVTIMQMDEGLDTGDMLSKRSISLGPEMDTPTLHDALAAMGAEMSAEMLDQLASAQVLEGEKQDDGLSTYASMLKKSDGQIDWSQCAEQIDRQVRALNPWPGTFAEIQGRRFKIKSVKLLDEKQADEHVGTLVDKTGRVICGQQSTLQILMLQPEGKKPMDIQAAINGDYLSL